jgi:23S rRNA pseudouridine1911/1915/1917 synthase
MHNKRNDMDTPLTIDTGDADDGRLEEENKPADYRRCRLAAPPGCAGLRLDQALASLLPEHSRSRLQAWIENGQVAVGGCIETSPKRKLKGGEAIDVEIRPPAEASAFLPEDIPLSIAYEDAALLAIDKPAGLVVHPAAGNWSGTLLNALLFHDPALAALPRAGIVHRLDKDTSGLMVVAKTPEAQTSLVRQLQGKSVYREYRAIAIDREGSLPAQGVIDAPIGRHPKNRLKMAVVDSGKPARTHFRVLQRLAACCLVACRLETGRTHQIRVHLAHLGHPIYGDPLYGQPAGDLPRQALHALKLGLIHPESGEKMQWEAPLPEDFARLLARLKEEAQA